MLAADIGWALLLAAVRVAAALGVLSLIQLYVSKSSNWFRRHPTGQAELDDTVVRTQLPPPTGFQLSRRLFNNRDKAASEHVITMRSRPLDPIVDERRPTGLAHPQVLQLNRLREPFEQPLAAPEDDRGDDDRQLVD